MTESHMASWEMGSLKAQNLDGYPPVFFKRTWDILGPAVHDFAEGVLTGKEVLMEAAEALLVLIAKEAKPTYIRSFRPISLCQHEAGHEDNN